MRSGDLLGICRITFTRVKRKAGVASQLATQLGHPATNTGCGHVIGLQELNGSPEMMRQDTSVYWQGMLESSDKYSDEEHCSLAEYQNQIL